MSIPLAEIMRPKDLSTYKGQNHLISEGAVLKNMVDSGKIHSMIFWGPPGSGKTTLAKIIAKNINSRFIELSAINSGVKDIRNAIDQAIIEREKTNEAPVLFIDEIHRFNKAQQDALLSSVETGIITLMIATTENPSFEVIAPSLSRVRYLFYSLLNIQN
ncbi:MAG: AAA family ATPase [Saprospiraceae bacterium]